MHSQDHAIMVTRHGDPHHGDQWRWILLDAIGETAGEGTTPTQEQAMESAQAFAVSMAQGRRSSRAAAVFDLRKEC